MSIPRLSAESPSSEITEALNEVGCVIVTGVTDANLRHSIKDDLAPHMEKALVVEDDDPEDFYAAHTRRVTALVARSPTISDQLVAHPISKQCCETLLLPNGEFGYQLHITASLEVGPGARAQILHRDDNSFTFFPVPRPNLIVASMWAITDFRADNGATLLVPGSHKWPAERIAKDEEIVPAEMPAGSVLYWLGGTIHGAGANRSRDWRYGVVLAYSVGWVRQEENQYMDIPPARLAELSPEVRQIAGFDMYRALGFYDRSVS